MDTVTEAKMAISMAQRVSVYYTKSSIEDQAKEVKSQTSRNGMIIDPTIFAI